MTIITTLIAISICAFPDVCIIYNGHAGLGHNG